MNTLPLAFALAVFLVCGFIGASTTLASSRDARERQRERWAHNMGIARDELIDNEPTRAAVILGVLWAVVGIYLAVAILRGNLFWVMALYVQG